MPGGLERAGLAKGSRNAPDAPPMNVQDAIDLVRQALWVGLLIGAPVLLVGMLVGLILGLLQALTQVQEQTVAMVPKIVAMAVTLAVVLPWALGRLLEYAGDLITAIPGRL